MAVIKLTDGVVEAAPVSDKDQYLWDSELRRFGVRITPAGARVYLVQYRAKAAPDEPSKTRKISIGRHDGKLWNATKARAAARRLLAPVDLDGDPFGERETKRVALAEAAQAAEAAEIARAAEAERQAREAEARQRDRFEAVAERYIALCLTAKRSGDQGSRFLRVGPAVAWKGRHIAEIRRGDVRRLIDDIRPRSVATARLTFSALRGLFGWCVECDLIDVSPCSEVKTPPRPAARDRVLSDPELKAIWQACDGLGYPFGPIVRLLMLTGQRRAEVAGMAWAEVDMDGGIWRIPKERTKNAKAHEIDLGPEALAILRTIPRDGPLIFPARRSPARKGEAVGQLAADPGAVRGFSATKRRLDELIGAEATATPWRLHDLRRTAATGMAGMNVAPHVIERVLNHISGVQGGLVAVYQRFDYRAERKAALLAWGAHVAALVTPPPAGEKPADPPPAPAARARGSNVVRLRA